MHDRRPPQALTSKPVFEGAKNAALDCSTPLPDGSICPWVYVGPRSTFQAAWLEHWAQAHTEVVAVVHIHRNMRERLVIAR